MITPIFVKLNLYVCYSQSYYYRRHDLNMVSIRYIQIKYYVEIRSVMGVNICTLIIYMAEQLRS